MSETWARWLTETRFRHLPADQAARVAAALGEIATEVLDRAHVSEGDCLLDVGTGTGMLALRGLDEVADSGEVIGLDREIDGLRDIQLLARPRLRVVVGDATALPFREATFDAVVTRSVLMYVSNRRQAAFEFLRVIKPGGRFSLCEAVNAKNSRLSSVFDFASLGPLGDKVRREEERFYDADDPVLTFDVEELAEQFEKAGAVSLDVRDETRAIEDLTGRFAENDVNVLLEGALPGRSSLVERWRSTFPESDVRRLVVFLRSRIGDSIRMEKSIAFVCGSKPESL